MHLKTNDEHNSEKTVLICMSKINNIFCTHQKLNYTKTHAEQHVDKTGGLIVKVYSTQMDTLLAPSLVIFR